MKSFLLFGSLVFMLLSWFPKISWLLEYTIVSCNGVDLTFVIYLDWISSLFLIVVFIVSIIVFIYSQEYMKDHYGRFNKLLLLFVLSIILIVISPNVLSILVGWDILGLVSFCLVVYYQSNNSYRAGIVTILINRVGDVALLICLPLIVGLWSTLTCEGHTIIGIFLIVAGCTKSAQIPFSSWLPAAIAAPTPVSSLVHSSTLVTAGIYLLIRYNWLVIELTPYLILIGVITILIAGYNAIQEIDMKKIVALSTLSQLGFRIFGLSIGLINIVLFHLLTHAFFKALIFLCVGIIIHNISQDSRFIGFIYSPIVITSLTISVFCLTGIPFLSGFYSKDSILEIFIIRPNSFTISILFILGTIFTVIYSFRLIKIIISIVSRGAPMYSLKETPLIISAIRGLCLFSIFFGGILQWVIPLYFCSINAKLIILILFIASLLPFMNSYSLNLDEISGILKIISIENEPEFQTLDWIPQWLENRHVYTSLLIILWILFVF